MDVNMGECSPIYSFGVKVFDRNMKYFILIAVVACGTTEKKSSTWNYNPQCPTEDAASACEDDCISAQADCVYQCHGNQDCIRQCSRDYASCTDACPCYPGCYNGCPCTYESQYCKGCEARFEKEHDVCKNLNKKTLDSCLDNCSFDESCENECLVLYHYDAKVCRNIIVRKLNPLFRIALAWITVKTDVLVMILIVTLPWM